MNKDNHYFFDGVDTVELAKKYGTPLYVMSETMIRENIRRLKKGFVEKYQNTGVLYASKAFMSIAMAKIVNDEDIGIDVVSGGELYTALQANFNAEKIYFHGNNKSLEEIELAISNDVGIIVVDNLLELELLEKQLKENHKRQNILLRLSPGLTEIDTHEYIITGQRDTKFGFQINDDLVDMITSKIMNSEYLDLKGFHYHIGSQLFDTPSYLKAFEIIFDLIYLMKQKFGFNTEILNIGGGFGIPYTNDQASLCIEDLLDEIMSTIDEAFMSLDIDRPRIIIEPGRWIVGPAGITIYEVGAIKEIEHIRTYASIDGGMTDNIRPALYAAKYSADVANKYDEEKASLYTIAGKACESGDILIKDVLLPRLESGDYLVIHTTGAYGFSMANNYNRHRIPAVVMTNNGEERMIIRRQSYDDLIQREII